jgi:predicted ATPase/transcriptional regulator with XRE-family HTH domain
LDLTQAGLARCVGCSVSAIRKIEADERRPSRQVAELLADCLDIPLAERPAFLKVARAELRVERLGEVTPVPLLSPQPEPGISALLPPRSPFDKLKTQPAPRHNLPTPPTPLIGREHELANLARLLQNPQCRLLTLVGPGGIGKTRLALEAASNQREVFADGVYFVSLAPLSSSEFIVPAIADAIGFAFYGPADPQVQLLTYLREKSMLLVLDNFEHLLPPPEGRTIGGTELLVGLLQQTPRVKLLVTSRELLHLHGEWVFEIQGLPVPPTDQTEELEGYSAAALFLQSAQRTHIGFVLTGEECPAVARLCRLVEGMPLGLELAAAWVRLLPCAEIAREIERNLDFLTASVRDAPTRHHSIRAVFDHSWKLLSADEQRVLQRLSVFRSSFRREAAEQVAGVTLSLLSALVGKSLLRPIPSGRYQMHELLRQFAAEKLEAIPPEQAAAQQRHTDYYLAFLQQRGEGLKEKQQRAVLAEIQEELDNVRAGWNWAVEQGQVESIERVIDSLYDFHRIRSRFQEGREAFAKAAECLQTPVLLQSQSKIVLARVLARQGAFCYYLGLYGPARALLQESLTLARQLEAGREVAFCLNVLGDITLVQESKHAEAKQLYQESLALYRELGEREGMVSALLELGWVCWNLREDLEAKQYYQECLTLSREISRPDMLASSLYNLAFYTFLVGEYSASAQYYQESLAIFKEIGNQLGIARAIGGLGLVAAGLGKLVEARQFFEESLAVCRETGHRYEIQIRLRFLGVVANSLGAYKAAQQYGQENLAIAKELDTSKEVAAALACLGEAAGGLGDFQTASRYLREALTLLTLGQHTLDLLIVLDIWAAILVQESELPTQDDRSRAEKKEQAVEVLALVMNHDLTPQFTKDKAARLLAKLVAELPPEVFAAARERGQAKSLDLVVAEIMEQTR